MTTRDDRRRGKPLRVLTTREMIGNLRASHYHRYELPLHSAPVCFPTGKSRWIRTRSACCSATAA